MPSLLAENAYVYQRIGLVGLAQTFFASGDSELEVRLYDVGETSRAQALYLWMTSAKSTPLDLGTEGVQTPTVIRCWKGKHVVEVRGALTEEDLTDKAKALAKSISDRITADGKPLASVRAIRTVLTSPPPDDIKVFYAEAELVKSPIVVPYHRAKDLFSLETYDKSHPVEVTLASVPISETTAGPTLFFLLRYPDARAAQQARERYTELAQKEQNQEIKNALLVRQGSILGGVWRPVLDAEALLNKVMTELES